MSSDDAAGAAAFTPTTWTGKVRLRLQQTLPYDKALPESQPSYMSSWIYVFGVLTLCSLAVVILSGMVLSFFGPAWYHISAVGLWVNSVHFWSVQLFFFFMVIHLWGKFFMAAWRGKRALTWITGVLAFGASVGAALTGYLVQTNFESQWIAFQAKDGLNAVGIGAWFATPNLGQMLLVHAALVPAVISVIVLLHILMVRVRGIVPPLDAACMEADTDVAASVAGGE